MPVYEYRCRECGRHFEKLRRMSDKDDDLICPECQSKEIDRLMSTFSSGGCKPTGSGGFS